MLRKTNKTLIYFFGALGGMLYGYDTGVISGALLYIQKDIPLSDFMKGFVVSALLIGAIVGSGLSGPLSDKWGRRRVVLLISIIFIIGALCAAVSPNALCLVLSRMIIGLAVGGSTALVPVYLTEMAPTHIRGSLASLNQLMITIGILVAYIVNYAFSSFEGWRLMLGFAALPALIMLIGITFMPESPRWLIKRNRENEARKIMKFTRRNEEIEKEIQEIKETETIKESAWTILKAPWIRPMLIAGIGLAIFQQIIGINAIIYYAPTIFSEAGLADSSSILGTVGIGIVNVLMTLVAIAVIDKMGRKKLMLWGNVGMTISLVVLAIILFSAGLTTTTAWITVVFLGLFIVFFAATWGPAVWVILPELFPLKARGAGTGLTTLFLSLGNLVVSLLFPVLSSAIGIAWVFLIFAIIGVFAFLFVAFFVPETKGRSLEAIENDLRNRK
ncbi:sugar porter (SP) family MFS transporter [Pullulanibacillus pueri]|uniref:Putative metabolite transport protein CsbC n=1 Tax=Pullulanibacillus pueri TaxID=1437324 RepID=A0A8J2ZTC1_9BACL|nr:sugar porter family MFS transporter [Pullulanibacillus pueri]MBM7681053.1 sugar porter (SP) family MFS transporter [Pullulanibacillus pueri]GGH76857.1 putative metabolite transport protein CsbC [Pullulanibacillus pueri]